MHAPMSTAQWEKRITPKKREREKEERMGLLSRQQAPGLASPPQTQSKKERKRSPGRSCFQFSILVSLYHSKMRFIFYNVVFLFLFFHFEFQKGSFRCLVHWSWLVSKDLAIFLEISLQTHTYMCAKTCVYTRSLSH